MVCEMTAMPLANASLLDEATAAAEALHMMYALRSRTQEKAGANVCFVDEKIWPQTLDVLFTRAEPLGIIIEVGDFKNAQLNDKLFGAIVQYPNSDGVIVCYEEFTHKIQSTGAKVAVAADLLSLALLTPPGEWGADIVFGSTQRFGVPMGYGGPSAAFFATRDEYKRDLPGRIIGVSRDANGKSALRLALQTREQHIKREKATSNICTSQGLLATMAGMYATYHGPEGIRNIAERVHSIASLLASQITGLGYSCETSGFFDTLKITLPRHVKKEDIEWLSVALEMNFRYFEQGEVGISIDETTNLEDINWILEVFAKAANKVVPVISGMPESTNIPETFARQSGFLKQEVFSKYRSETEMARYIKRLEKKDISLVHSMISLGSCTMKLNAATEMLPLSWIEFNGIHPYVPKNQAMGYHEMMEEMRRDLAEITGFADISFQPNSGAAGEYAGLLVIRDYHKSRGEGHRNVVLIPSSAHGTNPASAVMAGNKVVVVGCDDNGNINVDELKIKAEEHRAYLAGFMVTYPSTHGVFEASIVEMCEIIHQNGGQVYMDGANMNAQVGLTNPSGLVRMSVT